MNKIELVVVWAGAFHYMANSVAKDTPFGVDELPPETTGVVLPKWSGETEASICICNWLDRLNRLRPDVGVEYKTQKGGVLVGEPSPRP
jgi:hypothetical protein